MWRLEDKVQDWPYPRIKSSYEDDISLKLVQSNSMKSEGKLETKHSGR